MQKYFDAHCHLQNVSNVAYVMARATDVGVCGAVCNGTNPADWADVLRIARNVPGVYGAVGVHPWYVQNIASNWATRMCALPQNYRKIFLSIVWIWRLNFHAPRLYTALARGTAYCKY